MLLILHPTETKVFFLQSIKVKFDIQKFPLPEGNGELLV